MEAKTKLRLVRDLKGETVSSMAKVLNIGVSRYYMIETGQRPATPRIAEKIALILGVKQMDIFLPQSFIARDIDASKAHSI